MGESIKLQHGEYMIKIKQINENNDIVLKSVLVKPLNQQELSDGWLRSVPRNNSNIHHFSIYLSQLPMNLWYKVRRTHTKDKNKDYYKCIKNSNYHYTIKNSVNDEIIFELFRNIMSKTPNINKINNLYKILNENRVKGWLMVRAQNMISNQ